VDFSRLSTGTKLASKIPKKFKKVSGSDLVPVLRVQKQLKNFFQKTVKMYLVPATNLKNKKLLRLVAGTVYGVFRYSRNKFPKKSDLKYFENQIFFYFLIENFMLTKNALDVYFPSSVFFEL